MVSLLGYKMMTSLPSDVGAILRQVLLLELPNIGRYGTVVGIDEDPINCSMSISVSAVTADKGVVVGRYAYTVFKGVSSSELAMFDGDLFMLLFGRVHEAWLEVAGVIFEKEAKCKHIDVRRRLSGAG